MSNLINQICFTAIKVCQQKVELAPLHAASQIQVARHQPAVRTDAGVELQGTSASLCSAAPAARKDAAGLVHRFHADGQGRQEQPDSRKCVMKQ